MKRKIVMKMTIWDNETTTEQKQDVLLYCEHAIAKTLDQYYGCPLQYKVTQRYWAGFTAEIEIDDWYWPVTTFLKSYNCKLCRLHYWNRDDEPLEWNYTIE